jgi:hypothetical protein
MTKQLIIGLVAEGSTDYRFLTNIIRRTFEELAFFCQGNVEILDVQEIDVPNKKFVEYLKDAAQKAHEDYGAMVLCIHKDADSRSDENTYSNSITPGLEALNNSTEELCRNIVPVVPIVETESWLLADKALFREEIWTDKTDSDLNIDGDPESITDPKEIIKAAIQIAYSDYPTRRHRPKISELYLPIGQKASLSELRNLSSFRKFENKAKESLRKINYLVE